MKRINGYLYEDFPGESNIVEQTPEGQQSIENLTEQGLPSDEIRKLLIEAE